MFLSFKKIADMEDKYGSILFAQISLAPSVKM